MLATVLQWTRRLSSIVVLAFILLSATVPAASPTRKQIVALIFFPGIVGVGLILAWWREAH